MIAATVVVLTALAPLPVAADVDSTATGCVLQSIALEEADHETLLRVQTDGAPASIGARVEPGEGVILDLGCTPGPGLSGREFAEGLVAALQLSHEPGVQDAPTALVVKIRGAFEYSVRALPGTVLVSLRAEDAAKPGRKIRVLEPLPLETAPQPPLPPPVKPATPIAVPPTDSPKASSPSSLPPPAPSGSEVASAVEDWARAWSTQQVEDYLSAYASSFRPPVGLTRPAWEAQRRSRLAAPAWIKVVLDAMEVHLDGPGRAVAAFRQSYSSNTFSDQVEKTLTFIQEDGHWRILREEAGRPDDLPALPFGETAEPARPTEPPTPDESPEAVPSASPTAATLVEGARISVRKAPAYDASYQFIPYPGGDPGWQKGSGTDIVIRAYRHASIDLQERIHQDVLAAADVYGIQEPDTHIDHRRVRNLRTFMRRHGEQLGIDLTADWRPGDVVFWALDGKRIPDHLGIVSDQSLNGRLLVIHHREGGPPREEDVLFAWTVRGHHRWLPAAESE